MMDEQCSSLALRLGEACQATGHCVTTAESCTGGGIAAAITEIAGSSGWFETGLVTYANHSKTALLGVSEALLSAHGAVSEPVVHAMVQGACRLSGASLGVSVSGVAGPGGGSPDKPVGTVWIAWGTASDSRARCFLFEGDRHQVRLQAVRAALEGLIEEVMAPNDGLMGVKK
ncbi:CinA family protein [Larsenimonas rhizosphaerae]|uniref:CinA family protein n=1 Tax=Larsenimonas rhizosphaerae TaxID=2944682 RepID=A0AA41ZDX2_9GAMM|nr:CinA family protein [Larsenimonas rhizosphaerae]MCM2129986.1 CinA family protein [Larsenimonas rhizosphaerae]MCX2522685.1 CinA family protein [Larsenimonas rhizosphaerae]